MRPRRLSVTAALAGAIVVTLTAGASALPARTTATPPPHDDTVPIAGTFAYAQTSDQPSGSVRGVINAVVRIPHGTAVFYALGSPQTGRTLDSSIMPTQSLGDPYSIWKFPAWSVGVLDTRGLNVYRPLVTSDGGCLCSSVPDLTGELDAGFRVGWAVLPPLPRDVKSVTVDFADSILIPNVPVGSRLPTPASAHPAPKLGQGWPKLPSASTIASADAKQATLPLAKNTSTASESVSTQKKSVSVALNANVLFAFDKATLTSAASATIADLAKRIDADATGTVAITGYTDSVGDTAYNQALSERRAAAVAAALKPLLTNAGVRLTTAGKGEADPVASNDTDAGRAANRRVTVTFTKAAS